jgi:hypothetical protein
VQFCCKGVTGMIAALSGGWAVGFEVMLDMPGYLTTPTRKRKASQFSPHPDNPADDRHLFGIYILQWRVSGVV